MRNIYTDKLVHSFKTLEMCNQSGGITDKKRQNEFQI